MTERGTTKGGVPMVKIDGGRVRALREEKGLTQLYLATAVEVTTDTISRWENRRYPTIKKENALRLAEALEVELDAILDQGGDDPQEAVPEMSDPPSARPTAPGPSPGRRSRHLRAAAAAFFLVLLALGWRFFHSPGAGITAERLMPDHTAPGRPLPVVVRVKSETAQPLSVILRERLPAGARARGGPAAGEMAIDPATGEMKWIHKMKGGTMTVGYLLYPPADAAMGAALTVTGTVNLRRFRGRTRPIGGSGRLALTPYHWADTNRDNRIDDQEILTVYEEYSEIPGLKIDLDFIEEAWFGNGYHWDATARRFVIDH